MKTRHDELKRATAHAMEQARSRGMTFRMIDHALSSGGKEYVKRGALYYECAFPPINCIVDLETNALVTVYWRGTVTSKDIKRYRNIGYPQKRKTTKKSKES